MRKLIMAVGLLVSAPAAIAGDAEMVQISPGVYMAIVKNHAGIFGHQSSTKKKAIESANEFAKSQGMEAVPIALEYRPAGGPGQWPAAEYQFRLVRPGGGEEVSLTPSPDVSIEVKGLPAPAQPVQAPASFDLYTEMMKLDDLRKRGLLTEQEFEAQKSRLLNR